MLGVGGVFTSTSAVAVAVFPFLSLTVRMNENVPGTAAAPKSIHVEAVAGLLMNSSLWNPVIVNAFFVASLMTHAYVSMSFCLSVTVATSSARVVGRLMRILLEPAPRAPAARSITGELPVFRTSSLIATKPPNASMTMPIQITAHWSALECARVCKDSGAVARALCEEGIALDVCVCAFALGTCLSTNARSSTTGFTSRSTLFTCADAALLASSPPLKLALLVGGLE